MVGSLRSRALGAATIHSWRNRIAVIGTKGPVRKDGPYQSEIEGHVEARKPRIEHGGRRQPRRTVGDRVIRLVVRRARVAVEQVIEIDRQVRPGPAESQVLADADVEGVERIGK